MRHNNDIGFRTTDQKTEEVRYSISEFTQCFSGFFPPGLIEFCHRGIHCQYRPMFLIMNYKDRMFECFDQDMFRAFLSSKQYPKVGNVLTISSERCLRLSG